MRSRARVKTWQISLEYRVRVVRGITKEFLTTLFVHSFAWTGSVEPCTGVLCETCQRCLRDIMILKKSEGTHHATASSMLAAVELGCRVCTCVWLECTDDCNIDANSIQHAL